MTGSSQDLTVNGNAKVMCGNGQSTNATVYIIDTAQDVTRRSNCGAEQPKGLV